ncbi:MAG: hypothetical protein AD742_12215 [Methylibium sp. NZG]|nr:MAG: hypothetical protein AD742_12215 [Methylibium sp. NZG]
MIAALCVVLALSAGCSALRFGYNQAPDLGYWWLDSYIDFDDAQTLKVRNGLTGWFAWHRSTQLPDYAQLLVRAQAEALADTTPARVCEWWATLSVRLDSAFERAVPVGADLMLSIGPKQVQHMERRYAKANGEFRSEFLQGDPAKRRKASVDRAIERAELLYGTLTDGQREQVARMVGGSPFDADLWFSERKRRQQDALQMLLRLNAEGAGRDKAEAALRAYIERWRRSPRDEYRRYAEGLADFNCSFAASLHNSTTAAQRQTAVQKLKGWEGDARALAAEGGR